jgi:hypothetical protein
MVHDGEELNTACVGPESIPHGSPDELRERDSLAERRVCEFVLTALARLTGLLIIIITVAVG